SSGTEKSYLTKLIIVCIKIERKTYPLIASTGIAAQNVEGFTIHSILRIVQTELGYQLLAFYNLEFKNKFTENSIFEGICVKVAGDLIQFLPVSSKAVFYSSVWQLFHSLFLYKSQRYNEDNKFYKMLKEIRFRKILNAT
ncbi:14323_t:CDS:2, partial [Funneliformis mosseae]